MGSVTITRGDDELTSLFESRKALALFCYLICEKRPIPRIELADLFWGDKPEKRGRANLSRVLNNISSILPDSLRTTQQDVQFEVAQQFEIDIQSINELSNKGDLLSLKVAANLFRGEFLDGLYIEDSADFEMWLTHEREQWRQSHISILNALFTYNLSHRRFSEALHHVEKMIKLVPWREESHQQMMMLYALSGERSKALFQYKQCCEILDRELGVQPSPETDKLYEDIVNGNLNDASQISRFLGHQEELLSPPNNLPVMKSELIGRSAELERINEFLLNSSHRVVTLMGPGGVGKTQLALHACTSLLSSFPDGIFFVSLESVISSAELLFTISKSINIDSNFVAQIDEICERIGEDEILIVLDNAEQLSESALRELDALISSTSNPKLLVTSRQALNVQGEHIFHLEGLAFPPEPEAEIEGQYGAIELFNAVAQRAGAHGDWGEVELAAIAEICRFSKGLPLAIEITASWTPIVQPSEILQNIRQSDEFLVHSHPSPDDRQQSIEVVLEQSWNLLDAQERQLLPFIGVFNGSFTLDAFVNVTGGGPSDLLKFVNKSLISRLKHGRFEIHDLLRRYLFKRLESSSSNVDQAREAHCNFYADWLEEIHHDMRGKNQHYLLDQISDDLPNIRSAWDWAIEHKHWDSLNKCAIPMHYYFAKRSHFNMAISWFSKTQAVIESLEVPERSPETYQLQTILILREGYFNYSQGKFDEAEVLLNAGLSLAAEHGELLEEGFGLNSLASIFFLRDRLDQAIKLYVSSLDKFIEVCDRHGMAMVYGNLGQARFAIGDLDESQELFDKSLNLYEELSDNWGIAYALMNLATLASLQKQYESAQMYLERCLMLRRSIGDRQGVTIALNSLGETYCNLGQFGEALNHFEESLSISLQIKDIDTSMLTRAKIGRLHSFMGKMDLALEQLRLGLTYGINEQNEIIKRESIIYLAELHSSLTNFEQSARVLGFISAGHSHDPELESVYESTCQSLIENLTAEHFESLRESTSELDEVELFNYLILES